MENIKIVCKKDREAAFPEKVFQIGEGNFLRAFVDWMVQKMNDAGVFEGSAVLCQPLAHGMAETINTQDGIYTVLMRGLENGKVVEKADVVCSVSRCINPYKDFATFLAVAENPQLQIIVSNTTEAGIAYHPGDKADDVPPASYPAKLTVFLYKRYQAFSGAADKGLLILPVELIERNGDNLKKYVLQYAKEWKLPEAFTAWLLSANCFANTLVDRIVTGYPRDEIKDIWEKLGYEDNILVTCEPFHTWVIEAPAEWAKRFPYEKAGLHVVWTDDMTPYRTRKVRILNGAHTVSVLAAFLAGHNIVLEMMNDPAFHKLLEYVLHEEIIPGIRLPRKELDSFAAAVFERFSNPFIKHRLLDISLNSVSKFKARCLDSLLEYRERTGRLPMVLSFGLAALIAFYKPATVEDGRYYGLRGDERYEIRDGAAVLAFFDEAWKSGAPAARVLANADFWGQDLTKVKGLLPAVEAALREIGTNSAKASVEALVEGLK